MSAHKNIVRILKRKLGCSMQDNKIKKIIIVGGGSSGWMAAATLAKAIPKEHVEIQLIESSEIGIIGVGEATLPQSTLFNKYLGLDEDDFMRRTKATFKLGIQFDNWGEKGDSYYHNFGDVGVNMNGLFFFQYWQRMNAIGKAAPIDDYILAGLACQNKKFMRPVDAGDSPLSQITYAFHFDAKLYANYLAELAIGKGVVRTEGKVVNVNLENDGLIKSVKLEDGSEHSADFFIDCSGFRSLLLGDALGVGYEDWSHWLPCDSAIAVPSATTEDPWPYTRSSAQKAGWQWRIPLQHRVGNGHVYSSQYMSEDEATSILLENIDGEALAEPRRIPFKTGRRKAFWEKNCIAIGLSSGFLEPLESTSLHFVQTSIARFLSLYPDRRLNSENIAEYNRQSIFDYECARDFIILHYHATRRTDTDFWNYCRTMDIPESLREKIDLYKNCGRVIRFNEELFAENSWFEVLHGQGIEPEAYTPLADMVPEEELIKRFESVQRVMKNSMGHMPSHQQFIDSNCKATAI